MGCPWSRQETTRERAETLVNHSFGAQAENPAAMRLAAHGAAYHLENMEGYIKYAKETEKAEKEKLKFKLPKEISRSFEHWRSVKDQDPKKQIIAHFSERGLLDPQGAAYFEPLDPEMFPDAAASAPAAVSAAASTHVGVSYQISQLTSINSVEETFKILIDLNLMYKITEGEKERYEYYQNLGSILFQDIADDPLIITKPPIFEIRNAVTTPEFIRERVPAIARQYDHRHKEWAWYVIGFTQIRCDCYEAFEMHRFPWTKNSLQISLQEKKGFSQIVLVPYNCRSTMPQYRINFHKKPDPTVEEIPPRGNTFKNDRSISNWNIEQHHIAFVPHEVCPPMASGAKYAMCVITIQCKQNANFYIWNTMPVVFFLPLLAMATKWECIGNLADRMSIVLALLLTMATYKVSISSWIPQKDYLTFMDIYIIWGFLWILLLGFAFGVVSGYVVLVKGIDIDDDSCDGSDLVEKWVTDAESLFMSILIGLWVALHAIIVIVNWREWFYKSWPKIMEAENENLADIGRDVSIEREQLMSVQFNTGMKPKAPE